jgi:hypothetical protein
LKYIFKLVWGFFLFLSIILKGFLLFFCSSGFYIFGALKYFFCCVYRILSLHVVLKESQRDKKKFLWNPSRSTQNSWFQTVPSDSFVHLIISSECVRLKCMKNTNVLHSLLILSIFQFKKTLNSDLFFLNPELKFSMPLLLSVVEGFIWLKFCFLLILFEMEWEPLKRHLRQKKSFSSL